MITTLLGFLSSPMGKIVGYAVAGVALLVILVGLKYNYDASIRHQALLTYNNSQMEQVIKSAKEMQAKMKEIQELQTAITNDIRQKTDNLNAKLDDLNKFLDETELEGSKSESSPLLKETIRRLQKEFGR